MPLLAGDPSGRLTRSCSLFPADYWGVSSIPHCLETSALALSPELPEGLFLLFILHYPEVLGLSVAGPDEKLALYRFFLL